MLRVCLLALGHLWAKENLPHDVRGYASFDHRRVCAVLAVARRPARSPKSLAGQQRQGQPTRHSWKWSGGQSAPPIDYKSSNHAKHPSVKTAKVGVTLAFVPDEATPQGIQLVPDVRDVRGIEGTSFGPFMAARNGLDTTRENPTAVTGGKTKRLR